MADDDRWNGKQIHAVSHNHIMISQQHCTIAALIVTKHCVVQHSTSQMLLWQNKRTDGQCGTHTHTQVTEARPTRSQARTGHITTAATAGHPFTFGKERMSQLIAGTIWVLKVTNQCTDRLQEIIIQLSPHTFVH